MVFDVTLQTSIEEAIKHLPFAYPREPGYYRTHYRAVDKHKGAYWVIEYRRPLARASRARRTHSYTQAFLETDRLPEILKVVALRLNMPFKSLLHG